MMKWILAASAMMVPGAAQAADVTFTVHDVTLTATIPAGYCVPMNTDRLIADTLASGDTVNVTLATLIRCDKAGRAEGPGNDYMLIKSPKAVLAATMPRAALLTALAGEYGKAEWQSGAMSKQATADAAKGLSDAINAPVDIKGDLAPRGTDGDCAYLGGTLNVNGGEVSYPIIVGGCITSAANKVVGVYAYDDPGKGGGVAGKMQTARNVAMTIRAAQ